MMLNNIGVVLISVVILVNVRNISIVLLIKMFVVVRQFFFILWVMFVFSMKNVLGSGMRMINIVLIRQVK